MPPLVVKTLESFGRIPLFFESIPNVKIIYILRHPCGVRYSLIRGESTGKFKDNTSVTESSPRLTHLVTLEGARKRGLTLALLLFKTGPERFGYWWVVANEKVLGECEKISHAKIVVYEELCLNPEKIMAEIYDFFEWEFSKEIKSRISNMTQRNDQRYYSVFKDPRKTMHAWKDGLEPEESRKIQEVLATSSLKVFWDGSVL